MLITRKSPVTGIEETRDLPVTQEQIDCYNNGELIQIAFSNLNPGDREFIKTGYTEDDWTVLFSEDAARDHYIIEACVNSNNYHTPAEHRRAIAFIGIEPEDQ